MLVSVHARDIARMRLLRWDNWLSVEHTYVYELAAYYVYELALYELAGWLAVILAS